MRFRYKDVKKRIETIGSEEVRQKNRFFMFLVVLAVALFVTAVFAAVFLAVGSFVEIIRNTPSIDRIDSVEPAKNKSIIYAADGSIMQELVESGSNRISVEYDAFPEDLINAVVTIEDSRFFEHEGVDVKGIIRAIGVALTQGNLREGASTITQQLIKNNLFDGGFETNYGDRLERKFQEQYLALQLEKQLDKKTILQYYLNTINFGNNCLGAEVASRRYFNKHVSELDLSECTVLVATTSSPARYDPIKHPENNQKRRQIILNYMLNNGCITQEEHDEALSTDVYKRVQAVAAGYTGVQTFSYFTDVVFEDVLSALENELGYSEAEAYSLLYSGGLRIYTTMEPELQKIVDQEVNNMNNYILVENGVTKTAMEYSLSYTLGIRDEGGHEFYYNETNVRNYFLDVAGKTDFELIFPTEEALREAATEFRDYILDATNGKIITENVVATLEPQTSVVLMDQSSGKVLAVSGGRGDKSKIGSLTLNRATQSTRQPGSTFKIVSTYAPALDLKGATLGTTYYDSELLIDGRPLHDWWGDFYVGYANIREAIMTSSNIVAVKCLENTVSENLALEYVKSFGITTLVPETDKSPVMTLGGLRYGCTNLEMTAAYATIANNGVYKEPIFWTKVTDQNGKTLLFNEQRTETVLKSGTAKLLTSAMQSTIEPEFVAFPRENVNSTNTYCRLPGIALAAKSGTTNDANDLWLIGYSPLYTVGVWCGFDESKVVGTGANYHRAIWSRIMEAIHKGRESEAADFDMSGLVKARICSKSGLLAKEGVCDECGDVNCHIYEEYFTPNTVPTEYCNRHVVCHICTTSEMLAGEYCPEKKVEDRIYFAIDDQDQDDVETDDTVFAIPEEFIGTTCDYHTTERIYDDDREETKEDEEGNRTDRSP